MNYDMFENPGERTENELNNEANLLMNVTPVA